jgi:undecaprenyl-diphosphatase
VWLSHLGTFGAVWLGLALVLALARRRPDLLLLVLAADALADLVAYAIKRFVDVERPPFRYAEPKALVHVPRDHSFPSGHAATSFACATMLAFAFPRLAVPLYLFAAAIAYSRVYVGVHYPFDVVGGALVGISVAIALRWLAQGPRRSRRSPPPG